MGQDLYLVFPQIQRKPTSPFSCACVSSMRISSVGRRRKAKLSAICWIVTTVDVEFSIDKSIVYMCDIWFQPSEHNGHDQSCGSHSQLMRNSLYRRPSFKCMRVMLSYGSAVAGISIWFRRNGKIGKCTCMRQDVWCSYVMCPTAQRYIDRSETTWNMSNTRARTPLTFAAQRDEAHSKHCSRRKTTWTVSLSQSSPRHVHAFFPFSESSSVETCFHRVCLCVCVHVCIQYAHPYRFNWTKRLLLFLLSG